ncbi:MAG: HDOD domain-containing protein [Nitrospinota bacterium]|nr:HDOD domain-containing protein [Nitrospinota bacterium]
MERATKREEIVKHIDQIPAFNATVSKVIQLSNDPNSQPKDFIHTISIDPSLTAKILRLISSAYFGVPTKVVSLSRAVVMLGINTVKNVAISYSMISSVKMRNDFVWFTSDQFWEHSLACAVASKMIAAELGIPVQAREEYFIAGLLHDIGKIIFVQHFPDAYAKILDPENRKGELRSQLEIEEFGLSHAELGSLMAKKWRLPDLLSDTIAGHHKLALSGDSYDRIKAAVHIADYVCNEMKLGIENNVEMEDLDTRAYEVLGKNEEEIRELFADLRDTVEEAKVFLTH